MLSQSSQVSLHMGELPIAEKKCYALYRAKHGNLLVVFIETRK